MEEEQQAFYPGRRFFARMFDLTLYSTLWSMILALGFRINISKRSSGGEFLDLVVTMVIMLALEPLLLQLFATTPGKAILGLRLTQKNGEKLSYAHAVERMWKVFGSGMGYHIPIYNLIRLWKSYKLCAQKIILPWDEEVAYTIKDRKTYRTILWIALYAGIIAGLFLTMLSQLIAPNTGALTIKEFAENHNYYAAYYGIDFDNSFLDENGKWTKKQSDGSVEIQIGHTQNPEYHFELREGKITQVSYSVSQTPGEQWIGGYTNHMIIDTLAFVGALNDEIMFSKVTQRIVTHIHQNPFEDFSFVESGVRVTGDYEYKGYEHAFDNLLVLEEEADENYFELNFSMKIE